MKYFTLYLLLGMIKPCLAQKKLQFSSINNYGFIIGDKKISHSIQTINGIKIDDWSVGLGVGIDWHNTRSVPIFLDIRKHFLEKENQPFVYVDGGISIPWPDKETKNWYAQYDFKNTFYGEVGGGYKFQLSPKNNLLLSAGYGLKKEIIKIKTVPSTETVNWLYGYGTNRYDFKYQRIVIRVGFSF